MSEEMEVFAKALDQLLLTDAEKKFFEEWRGGMLVIVNNVDEALEILKRCK